MSAAQRSDHPGALLSRMTLEQKLGQMTQPERQHITPDEVAHYHIGSVLSGGGSWPGKNQPADWVAMNDAYWAASVDAEEGRMGIPLLYGVDAVHGHNNVRGAVLFPHNIGLGAANDPDLIGRIAAITAREVLATGVEWTFAPTLAVVRDDHWGRTYESYSEDPEIVSRYAGAFVRGLQGDLGRDAVVACVKHWVGDGGTTDGVDQGRTDVPEDEFRALHIAPYRPAVDAGALTVMASYNSWNGVKCHANRYLLTDVLKGELGFDGFVVSDWDAIDALAEDYAEAIRLSVNAGVDMFMVPDKWKRFLAGLKAEVEAGRIPMERIDDAVRRDPAGEGGVRAVRAGAAVEAVLVGQRCVRLRRSPGRGPGGGAEVAGPPEARRRRPPPRSRRRGRQDHPRGRRSPRTTSATSAAASRWRGRGPTGTTTWRAAPRYGRASGRWPLRPSSARTARPSTPRDTGWPWW